MRTDLAQSQNVLDPVDISVATVVKSALFFVVLGWEGEILAEQDTSV